MTTSPIRAVPGVRTVTDRIAEGIDALAEASTMGLLTAAYALTHRIHAADDRSNNGPNPRLRSAARDHATDLRAQRDLIAAEVLRRTGGQ